MKKPTGYILWQGASLLDGAPIVAIAVLHSDNVKTGDMVQTFILRADISPVEAVKTGADASICGDCNLRGERVSDAVAWPAKRACYVNVAQSPSSVWRAFQRGSYPVADAATARRITAGRMVRLGAYGDPAAVPEDIWRAITIDAAGHTGYTHQWRTAAPSLASLCMASADSASDALDAWSAGWRTFRVTAGTEVMQGREIVCPTESRDITCEQCGLCEGNGSGAKSITIPAHGIGASFVRAANT